MTIASNQYASKVFSEHPIASWPLDDECTYISLITESQRDFANWSEINNGTESEVLGVLDLPFSNSIATELSVTDYTQPAEAFSANLFNLQDLNQEMNTFALNLYLYTNGSIEYYEYGYRYIDPYSAQYIEDTRTVTDTRFATWIRMGGTFNPPNYDTQAQIVFRVKFSTAVDASVIMNGLSVGQWSESSSNYSLGVFPQPVDAEIQAVLGSVQGIQVQAYAISEKDGYILSDNGRMLATNQGIPMVFGSDNVTRLNPSTLPSIVLPGCGVLNESGKYNSYTVEMWMRIENNSAESKRIWGPIASDYGLYIKRGFLYLIIGNSIGSYFIAEWYRPMLVHIIIKEDSASLLINGEEVISISFSTSSLDLPAMNEDWLGFYRHDHMPIFELDCVSVLPYPIPSQVAKRRFVWGQGVESPETINSAYEGTVAYIDYPFAQYTANQTYPDTGRWDAAYFENLLATRQSISVPDYQLPTTIELGEKTLDDLYADNLAIQEVNHANYITFRPNETWTEPCYYYYSNINQITDVVRGIWGVFEIESATLQKEPIMHFIDTNNPTNRLEINIEGTEITYSLYKNGTLYPTQFSFNVELDAHFVVGFHLPRLFNELGSVIGEFFGNPSAIKMYVGGDGEKTFSGLIYRVGFSNQTNLNEIENHFEANGIASPFDGDLLNDHVGSYTLLPIKDFNRFFLDIAVSSYWEEYYPLSFFAGYSYDSYGKLNYDLDFLQYNIGYPTTTTVSEQAITGSWTYAELAESYAAPITQPYEALDNSLITGYQDYEDLKNKVVLLRDYDFSQSSVRTYITFQKVSDGANKPLTEYTNYQSLPVSNILNVPQFENQFSTKYEIKDQSLIYPPTKFSVEDTAAVIHLDVKIYGIKTNPLNIRKMSLVSKSQQDSTFNSIGTRFGSKLYPYSKTGIYFDNKKQNPYMIYKDSSPYLYLTKHSGIQSLGLREFGIERGISFPINEQQASNQKVSAMQLWIKYTDEFGQIPVTLFSIDGQALDIGFNVVTDQSGERGKLYAVDLATGQDYISLSFYQDGIPVITPYLQKNVWTVIGINFGTPINLSNYVGAINLFQSAVFNNIAYYRATSLQESKSVIYRKWDNIDGTPLSPLEWYYWKGALPQYGLWDNVLKLAETGIYGVSPETLFKSYSGTNRQVVDDNAGLLVSQTDAVIFASEIIDVPNGAFTPREVVQNSPEWSFYTQKPA